MKKHIKILASLFLLSFAITHSACQSSQTPAAAEKPATGGLAGSMQGLKDGLTRLLPMIVDPDLYNKEENRKQIDQLVSDLYVISKQVNHNPVVGNMDPSLRFISNAFTDDLQRAEESLKLGKREYARYTMMNMTAYCVECHTRTSTGPSFDSPQLEKALMNLRRIDRAEYLLAIRQFDRAFVEFETFIQEGLKNGVHFFDLDKAVRYGLSISIKFHQDPKKSLALVSLIENNENAPYYLRQNAKAWANALREWTKESAPQKKTVVDQLKRAQTLVQKGRDAQMAVSDRGGDIYFLRALSELHQTMVQNLNREQMGQALYLTGISYDAVRDLSVWSLHENYYESCIRRVPHSTWSERCYKKLEESIYFGFTGSSGLRVPVDVQLKLKELQKLALPETIKLKN